MTAKHRVLSSRFDVARYHLDLCGGLSNSQELADRWGVTRSRVLQLREVPGFPRPATVNSNSPLYFTGECDAWRAARTVRRAS